MVRPNVSPPSPHITPQNQHQNRVWESVEPRTSIRCGVWIAANSQGANNHENSPPVSQKISQDHSRMRLYGT